MRFILHTRPKQVSSCDLKFKNSFGLGGSCFLLLVILFLTGAGLSLQFDPKSPITSVKEIINVMPFGWYIWKLHYICSQLIIILIWLHLTRIIFKGNIYEKGDSRWLWGLLLFVLVFLSLLSGYFLRGDKRSELAKTVLVNLLHLGFLKNEKLIYSLHTVVLPWLIGMGIFAHFYYIRTEKLNTDKNVPASELFKREKIYALFILVLLNVSTILIKIPKIEKFNPLEVRKREAAAWFFRPFQNLLMMVSPKVVLSLITFIFAILLFYPKFVKKMRGKLSWLPPLGFLLLTISIVVLIFI